MQVHNFKFVHMLLEVLFEVLKINLKFLSCVSVFFRINIRLFIMLYEYKSQ